MQNFGFIRALNDFITKYKNEIYSFCIISIFLLWIFNLNAFFGRISMLFVLLLIILCMIYQNQNPIARKFGRLGALVETYSKYIRNFICPSRAQIINNSFRAQNFRTFESSNAFENIKGSFLDKTKEMPFNQYSLQKDKIFFNNATINEQMTDKKRNSSTNFFEKNQKPIETNPHKNDYKERLSPMSKAKNLKGFYYLKLV